MISAEWFGAIGQWAGAIATVGAVWVALWLPKREARRRREEQARELYEQAERAARLMRVSGFGVDVATERNEYGQFLHQIQFAFCNCGSQPVLDLHTEAWWTEDELEGPPGAAIQHGTLMPGEPAVAPNKPQYGEGFFRMSTPRHEERPPVKAWRVRWTDVHGFQWCVDQRGQGRPLPYKDGQPPRPSR